MASYLALFTHRESKKIHLYQGKREWDIEGEYLQNIENYELTYVWELDEYQQNFTYLVLKDLKVYLFVTSGPDVTLFAARQRGLLFIKDDLSSYAILVKDFSSFTETPIPTPAPAPTRMGGIKNKLIRSSTSSLKKLKKSLSWEKCKGRS